MGAYLDKPIEDKNPQNGNFNQISYGACSMQGWRTGMEDAHLCVSIDLPNGKKGSLFGVFDGHGGEKVAAFASENLKEILSQQESFKKEDYENALIEAFLKLDADVKYQDYSSEQGTTSCVLLITPDKIFCANAGDSRGVLNCGEEAIALSDDHKPDLPKELDRIKKSGHNVSESRVDGSLALSRAFGDFQYKDDHLDPKLTAVTAFPDVTIRNRTQQDQFIMLACDGIWDCLSNDECIKVLREKINNTIVNNKFIRTRPVEEMLSEILAPNTDDGIGTDNMTAILITFDENMKLQSD